MLLGLPSYHWEEAVSIDVRRRAIWQLAAMCGCLTLAACSHGQGAAAAPQPEKAPPDSVSLGYGGQARRDVSGAVSSLDTRDLELMRVARVEELIEGRMAGVVVVHRSDGRLSLRVRGASAFLGDGEPLL